ncbi:UNVERIFIED_CONTAM: hypothetical protein FKN15_074783 [Acipenser sinensis]
MKDLLPRWRLNVVLNALTKPPFEPMHSAEQKFVSFKTAFLLAITSAKRSPVKVLEVRLKLVPKPLSCPLVPTSTVPSIELPIDLTATIRQPTEDEDGDPGKLERGKGGGKERRPSEMCTNNAVELPADGAMESGPSGFTTPRLLIMESLASANTSLRMTEKLTNDRKAENIFYSPLSISSALAMVYLGARGNTAAEMAQLPPLQLRGRLPPLPCRERAKRVWHFSQNVDAAFAALVKTPTLSGLAKDPAYPNRQCRITELHLKKGYSAATEAVRLSNVASLLSAQLNVRAQGRSIASVVVARRQLWLLQERVQEHDKDPLLDAPITQGHTFGPAVEKMLQHSAKAHEASQQMAKMLLIMASLASANTNFALDLFKKLSNDRKAENIFYSPLSISSALAMVYLGARGNTAAEMAQSVRFNKSQDAVHSGFRTLISDINKPSAPYKLCLANRLYGEKSFHFVTEFIQNTKMFYQAELEAVDFVTASEAARQNINSWVQSQTKDKIQNLLAEGTVDALTRLVLVNAIYFKGNWGKKFSESETKERPFRLSKNGTKPVQMMQQKAKFNLSFIPEVNSQIIELPYVGNDLSMLIVLPMEIEDDSTGLEKLERELTFENLMEWTKPEMMDNTEVTVTLPKFKLEETYDLKSVLISLGMVDAFDVGKSDFSGMSSNNELVLSKVVHKSFVEVNEEGTEAAAATVAIMMMRCAMIPVHFNADHPFLFFIRHNKTRNILFYGRFSSP